VGDRFRSVGRGLAVLVLAVAAVGVGYVLHGCLQEQPAEGAQARAAQGGPAEKDVLFWTCSMHPQIRQPGPGKCPICHMDLVPVRKAAGSVAGTRTLTTTPEAAALMGVQTSPVERRFVTAEVRLVGKVTYDETRVRYLTAWVAGRLDRLYVDYTGVEVRKGDHMVSLYSPELVSAQEELLQALKAEVELSASDIPTIRESATATAAAARKKLQLLGLKEEQVQEIVKRGSPTTQVTIYAPLGGTVIEKNGAEGMYVEVGTRIYTIADLSKVWVKLDAYESDLVWLRYGQKVTFTTEASPGETFQGWIAFIDPIVDDKTRTVKVRVNVPNAERKLKPEMFVRGLVRASVAASGRVMDPDLAGKWICPMHPEIVKDKAGQCDICGMDLVTSEALGYLPAVPKEEERPLVIPVSAALVTGVRAVVYVEDPKASEPTFEGREIVLGPRAGDYYVVRLGLEEGELVVTRGSFKIDSALQIQAKPSMMNPEGGGAAGGGHHHGGQAPAPPASGGGAQTPAPGGHVHE